jgi:hypothetical protein
MLPQLPRRVTLPTPLVVLLVVVVVLSLGGVGFAAGQITSAQIKNNSVKGQDVKNSSLTGKDLKDSSVTGADVADSSLSGRDVLNGSLGSSDLRLQKGETLRGAYAISGSGSYLWEAVTLPVPAPVPIDSAHVIVVGYDVPNPAAGCTGSVSAPTAGPGYACVYPSLIVDTNFMYGWGLHCSCGNPTSDGGDGSRFGFLIQSQASGPNHSNKGSWAYTAP